MDAPDVLGRVQFLVEKGKIEWVLMEKVKCFRSTNASTRAAARIWGLGRIWQQALEMEPAYIIEVISERFDKLNEKEKDMVLLHELAHIPKNFSGALMPHRKGKGGFHDKLRKFLKDYENYSITR